MSQMHTRMIADAQIHLWKAESDEWKWVPGRHPQLPEPFTIERALKLMDEGGVDRAVVVPPSVVGDRNDYGIEAATRYPERFAVMGRLKVEDPKSADLLPNWKQQKGMLGVRLTFQAAMAQLFDQAGWFWPLAEKYDLPVMFLSPGLLPKFAPIAERYPGLQLIIDHMSLTLDFIKERGIKAAIDDVVALSKYQNVSVKISSSPYLSKEDYPYKDMTVHLKRCFDAYGPRRCHWGTDITNSLTKATYKQRIEHFTRELDFMSEDDKDWVMGKAIMATLGWK